MRTAKFLEADPHGPMVKARFRGNSPPQVDRLKLKTSPKTAPLQLREGITLQGISLRSEVAERRTYEDANDGPLSSFANCSGHNVDPMETLIQSNLKNFQDARWTIRLTFWLGHPLLGVKVG